MVGPEEGVGKSPPPGDPGKRIRQGSACRRNLILTRGPARFLPFWGSKNSQCERHRRCENPPHDGLAELPQPRAQMPRATFGGGSRPPGHRTAPKRGPAKFSCLWRDYFWGKPPPKVHVFTPCFLEKQIGKAQGWGPAICFLLGARIFSGKAPQWRSPISLFPSASIFCKPP